MFHHGENKEWLMWELFPPLLPPSLELELELLGALMYLIMAVRQAERARLVLQGVTYGHATGLPGLG